MSNILTSSTIIYFSGLGLYSFTLNLLLSLSQHKYLCIVNAGKLVVSAIFFAALPVGANKAISSFLALNIPLNKLTIAFIIVVLPVPGPPVIIVKLLLIALFIAFL